MKGYHIRGQMYEKQSNTALFGAHDIASRVENLFAAYRTEPLFVGTTCITL